MICHLPLRSVVDDPTPGAPKTLQPPTIKPYKTYSEAKLKEAISAVLERGVRLLDASREYKIPLTTLSRKIRSPQSRAAKPPDANEAT